MKKNVGKVKEQINQNDFEQDASSSDEEESDKVNLYEKKSLE